MVQNYRRIWRRLFVSSGFFWNIPWNVIHNLRVSIHQSTLAVTHEYLHPIFEYVILKTQREQPPTRGWPHQKMLLRKHHPKPAKVQRVVFLCLKCYLQNENTNVSNAKINIPKAIRSLKSKCFISTTPILCRIEVIHPVTRLFLDGSLTHFILYFNIISLYFVIHFRNICT